MQVNAASAPVLSEYLRQHLGQVHGDTVWSVACNRRPGDTSWPLDARRAQFVDVYQGAP
jgi:hypothetical protein